MKFRNNFYFLCALTLFLGRSTFADEFKPSIEIKGKMYLQLTGDLSEAPALKYDGFSVERTYVDFLGSLTENVATRLTVDLEPGALDYKFLYVKYACADFKTAGGKLKLTVGQQGTHWVGFVDDTWGYRAIQKSLTDFNKVLSSADIGLGLTMKIPAQMGEVLVQALNGAGYKNSANLEENNFQKDVAARATVKPVPGSDVLKGLALSAGIQDKNVEGEDDLAVTGLVSYSCSFLNAGLEVLKVMGNATTDKTGISVYADIGLGFAEALKNAGLIARYDTFDPDDSAGNDGSTLFVAGPRYKMGKHMAAVVFEQQDLEGAGATPTKLVKAVLEARF